MFGKVSQVKWERRERLKTFLYSKPVMPVHHMAAHALMPRLEEKLELPTNSVSYSNALSHSQTPILSIPFPYLVLLVSGGHCILAVAHSSNQFSRLGQTRDDSPGEAFDKLARW